MIMVGFLCSIINLWLVLTCVRLSHWANTQSDSYMLKFDFWMKLFPHQVHIVCLSRKFSNNFQVKNFSSHCSYRFFSQTPGLLNQYNEIWPVISLMCEFADIQGVDFSVDDLVIVFIRFLSSINSLLYNEV